MGLFCPPTIDASFHLAHIIITLCTDDGTHLADLSCSPEGGGGRRRRRLTDCCCRENRLHFRVTMRITGRWAVERRDIKVKD